MDGIVHDQVRDLDALVVGAGFGGIYMLHKLRNELGLDAVAIDKAGGVGGTWYWNKYPGALSDSEGFVYQYSFDRDLYAQTPWTTKFVTAARDSGLPQRGRRSLRSARAHRAADRDDPGRIRRGRRHLDRAHRPRRDVSSARFLVTGLGLLSATNLPDCPAWRALRAAWCTPVPGRRTWT